uniref:Uncharacterized protein n=1 Tax=Rhizophora mucronata TaxID=61149 RepID=A0A2P2N396_RHIMU
MDGCASGEINYVVTIIELIEIRNRLEIKSKNLMESRVIMLEFEELLVGTTELREFGSSAKASNPGNQNGL